MRQNITVKEIPTDYVSNLISEIIYSGLWG
jgi:hypothetical protein